MNEAYFAMRMLADEENRKKLLIIILIPILFFIVAMLAASDMGTTAGTAAEVTINYVITDEEAEIKMVCVDPNDIPILAIIDSELMASMILLMTGLQNENLDMGEVMQRATEDEGKMSLMDNILSDNSN